MWQRFPECGFPLQAWEESSFDSDSGSGTRIGALLLVLGRGDIVKVLNFARVLKKGLLAVCKDGGSTSI